jgi:predicted Zn finger-like uncharacterized protein
MPAPEASLVVIACPHCGTRYQLAYEAIGAKGRSVACAHCGESWEARADPPPRPARTPDDPKFTELAEKELDEKFRAEERRHQEKRAARAKPQAPSGEDAEAAAAHQRTLDEIKAAVAVRAAAEKPSPNDHKRQQREFSQRQKSLYSNLPRAKARRLLRLAAFGAVIVVFGGGLVFRNAVVSQFPQLAESYAALGMKVNVVGLEFSDLSTVKSLDNGDEVLVVDGKINNVAGHEVSVPQVIVTLTDHTGAALYEWSMTPRATELEPGETVGLETRLTSPPVTATGVRLSFAEGDAPAKPVTPPRAAGMDDSAPAGDDAGTTTSSGGP